MDRLFESNLTKNTWRNFYFYAWRAPPVRPARCNLKGHGWRYHPWPFYISHHEKELIRDGGRTLKKTNDKGEENDWQGNQA